MNRDFAALLDEMLNSRPQADDAPPARPTIPFDVIAPQNALDAFWSSVSSEFVAGLYRDADGHVQAEPQPLPIKPEQIAAELGLDRAGPPKNLDRLRRSFAFRNHPDRVAPELRERAMLRMQIANRLIDEAKRKAAPAKKA